MYRLLPPNSFCLPANGFPVGLILNLTPRARFSDPILGIWIAARYTEIVVQAAAENPDRPPLLTYEDVADRLELPLLSPALSEEQVEQACRLACQLRLGSICVRPSDADLALRWVEGAGITVASVVAFPWGCATTPVKAFEVRDLIRRGIREIGVVAHAGRLASRQFQYVESEIRQLAEECHKAGARLRVIFENGLLNEELTTILCKICRRAGADVVDACTGFGARGATVEDLRLMRLRTRGQVTLKATGLYDTFSQFQALYAEGAERVATIRAARILEEWRKQLEAPQAQARQADSPGSGSDWHNSSN